MSVHDNWRVDSETKDKKVGNMQWRLQIFMDKSISVPCILTLKGTVPAISPKSLPSVVYIHTWYSWFNFLFSDNLRRVLHFLFYEDFVESTPWRRLALWKS
jgi:hypothetical protein